MNVFDSTPARCEVDPERTGNDDKVTELGVVGIPASLFLKVVDLRILDLTKLSYSH